MESLPPQTAKISPKHCIWFLGASAWFLGILDRSVASFADGYVSAIDFVQLSTAIFFFAAWLVLKPAPTLGDNHLN